MLFPDCRQIFLPRQLHKTGMMCKSARSHVNYGKKKHIFYMSNATLNVDLQHAWPNVNLRETFVGFEYWWVRKHICLLLWPGGRLGVSPQQIETVWFVSLPSHNIPFKRIIWHASKWLHLLLTLNFYRLKLSFYCLYVCVNCRAGGFNCCSTVHLQSRPFHFLI